MPELFDANGFGAPGANLLDGDGIPLPPEPPPEDEFVGEWVPPGDDGAQNDPEPPRNGHGGDQLENAIGHKMTALRVAREANRRLDDEARPPVEYPPIRGLSALLAEPDSVTPYRIESVAPADARVLLSAQYKAGKSTLVGNLLHSLADGTPFLGKFRVHTPAQRVVLIDDELSENTLRQWLRAHGITNTAAVADVVTLRGRVGAFNLLDDRCRGEWAQRLRDLGADYLVLDCLRPVLDALGLDEHRDAGQFLVALDALLTEAGIRDALLVHHMGHQGERSRGDSRLQDWPDAIWRLVRESDEPDSTRYFSAYGRDVDVAESRLSFDPATRQLTHGGGSRRDARKEAAAAAVVVTVANRSADDEAGLSGRAIERALDGEHLRSAVRDGIRVAIEHRLIETTVGPRNAKVHTICDPCERCRMPMAGATGPRHFSCPPQGEGLFEGVL